MAKTYDTYKDSGIAWIGEIPSEWEVVRQKNVFTLGKELIGDNWATTQLLSLTTKGIKCISIGNTSGKVPDSYNTYQTVKPNNLVMCLFDLDCSAVFSGISSCSGMISPAYKVLTVNEGADPRYYSYWFDFIFDGRKYMYLSKNIRYSLTYDEFAALGIVYPSLSEQQSIATFLDTKCVEIDALISLQEEMISELQAYKQSVITEAVTKGLNPNAKMKDSGVEWIGEIPEEWNTQKLRTLGSTQNGISQSGDYFGDEFPYPFVSYPDAYKNYSVPYPEGRANSTTEERNHFSLIEGDVLFTRTSETIEEIGFASTCMNTIPDAVYSGFLIRFRPNTDKLFKGYSKYYFRSQIHRAYFVKEMNLVTRASLSQDLLKNLVVLLPPLTEQHSIATYLDEKTSQIDSLIALKQEKIQELKDYKKSIIYEYVTGKKRV